MSFVCGLWSCLNTTNTVEWTLVLAVACTRGLSDGCRSPGCLMVGSKGKSVSIFGEREGQRKESRNTGICLHRIFPFLKRKVGFSTNGNRKQMLYPQENE